MKRVALKLEEINIGDKCQNSFLVSMELLDNFMNISGDFSRLHSDEDFAKLKGYKNRVVHGALISSFFSSLIGTKLPGDSALLLEMSCKYHSCAYVGDIIIVKGIVTDIHENLSCIIMSLKAESQKGKKLSSGKALIKVQ